MDPKPMVDFMVIVAVVGIVIVFGAGVVIGALIW